MSNHEVITQLDMVIGPHRIKRGEEVLYDGRANGQQSGIVTRVEAIKGRSGAVIGYWFHIKGAGLLVPLEDIIEVLSR